MPRLRKGMSAASGRQVILSSGLYSALRKIQLAICGAQIKSALQDGFHVSLIDFLISQSDFSNSALAKLRVIKLLLKLVDKTNADIQRQTKTVFKMRFFSLFIYPVD